MAENKLKKDVKAWLKENNLSEKDAQNFLGYCKKIV